MKTVLYVSFCGSALKSAPFEEILLKAKLSQDWESILQNLLFLYLPTVENVIAFFSTELSTPPMSTKLSNLL